MKIGTTSSLTSLALTNVYIEKTFVGEAYVKYFKKKCENY